MVKLLSWNIKNKKTTLLQTVLSDLVTENLIDIVILQEAFGTFINTVLNPQFDEIQYPKGGVGSGVRIFLKKKVFQHFSIERTGNKKLVFIHLKKIGGIEEFNIAAVHFYSKVGKSERQQLWKNLPLVDKIKEFEITSSNNNRTILVGDFNHNPYGSDLVDPNMINSKDSRNLIATLTRYPLTKKKMDYWYSPMWNLLGDLDYRNNGERVTGTYFQYTEDERQMWNLIDGFILRPSIMDRVNYDQSEIITNTKSTKFLKPFIIRKDESLINDDLSDHLPVKFTLDIN